MLINYQRERKKERKEFREKKIVDFIYKLKINILYCNILSNFY